MVENKTVGVGRRTFLVATGASVAIAAAPALAKTKRHTFILPDISGLVDSTKIIRDNCITTIYRRMTLLNMKETTWSWARTDSPLYRDWLRKYEPDFDIAPHIGFGGCVVPSTEGDPTFYPRWQSFARELTREWWAQ